MKELGKECAEKREDDSDLEHCENPALEKYCLTTTGDSSAWWMGFLYLAVVRWQSTARWLTTEEKRIS